MASVPDAPDNEPPPPGALHAVEHRARRIAAYYAVLNRHTPFLTELRTLYRQASPVYGLGRAADAQALVAVQDACTAFADRWWLPALYGVRDLASSIQRAATERDMRLVGHPALLALLLAARPQQHWRRPAPSYTDEEVQRQAERVFQRAVERRSPERIAQHEGAETPEQVKSGAEAIRQMLKGWAKDWHKELPVLPPGRTRSQPSS